MAKTPSPPPDRPNEANVRAELEGIFDRLDELEKEKQSVTDREKEEWAHAKARGFNVKVMKEIRKIRKDPDANRDFMREMAAYCRTLGYDDTPLGEWAETNDVGVQPDHRTGPKGGGGGPDDGGSLVH